MRRLVLLAVMFLGFAVAFVAQAQERAAVSLRANVQDGFIRLVFTGAGLPRADVNAQGDGTLSVVFDKPVNVANVAAALLGVSPATSIAPSADGRSFTITTGAMTRHRTLALGQRLFVDIFTKSAPKEAAAKPAGETPKAETPKTDAAQAETPKPEKPKAETPKIENPPVAALKVEPLKTDAAKPAAPASLVAPDEGHEELPVPASLARLDAQQKNIEVAQGPVPVIVPDDAEEAPPVVAVAPVSTETAPGMPAVPVGAVDATPVATVAAQPEKPFTGSATITLGSTQGLALAVFVREGYLWIVMDHPQLAVPPEVTGPDAAQLGAMDRITLDGGQAYRLKMPQGAHVRPEGGGLIWRLYIQPKPVALPSVAANRDFSDAGAGPMLRLPLRVPTSVLRVPDPIAGSDLAVVTVGRADTRLNDMSVYVDFDVIPAIVGAVLRPKADGVRVAVLPNEVTVGRQGGLRITSIGPRGAARPVTRRADGAGAQGPSTVFDFERWALGGPAHYLEMRRSIDDRVASMPEDRKLPEILNGAKFMLAQGLPEEAEGFIGMAQGYMPALVDSGEFQALRGAVSALRGQVDDAKAALAAPSLQKLDEMGLWRAYVMARSGDMTGAEKAITPQGLDILDTYPARIQAMMMPDMMDAELARGDVSQAEAMLEAYEKASELSLTPDRDTIIAFYKGRIAQLRGDDEAAIASYRKASDGRFGPYPVRATMALVERGLSSRTITRDDAVAKLERFRYGWRGDDLETQISQRLGLLYVTNGEQRRGLTILRNAATLSDDQNEREKIVAVMQKAFRELYSGKSKEKMTPIEAAAVAADFAELMPAGGDGEAITMTIADQMVAIDLLDRAADMIDPLVERTASLSDALKYAERAAAIRILNDQPDMALAVLNRALARADASAGIPAEHIRRLALLRAKAKGELKRTDDALAELATLPEDTETLGLKADIAWSAQRWPVAAEALDRLVKASNLSATRAPTLEQAQLVLNEALALNLAGDTVRLEQLRVSYGDIMRLTDLNQPFQLVTRIAQTAALADRETLLKLVSEVDMFKTVLEKYKQGQAPAVPDQKAAPVAPAPAQPAENAGKPAQ